MIQSNRSTLALLLLVAAATMLPDRADAIVRVIANSNNSGPGSLRQELAEAASGDVLIFDAGLAGMTVGLLSPLEIVDKAIEVRGPSIGRGAASPSIDLLSLVGERIFEIHNSGGEQVQIRDVRMMGGRTPQGLNEHGGCILADADTALVLRRVEMRDCRGTDPYDNGGAIAHFGSSLEIHDSTFENNEARLGGAIYAGGDLFLHDSIVKSNQAARGAGVYALTGVAWFFGTDFDNNGKTTTLEGGAIYADSIYVENSMFYSNRAGSGSALFLTGGGSELVHLSVGYNVVGPALAQKTSTTPSTIRNSIVAWNPAEGYDGDCVGPFLSGGHNVLVGCAIAAAHLGDVSGIDPKWTTSNPTSLELRPGSIAIEFVPASGAGCLATDLAGLPRPQYADCDAGAREFEEVPNALVPIDDYFVMDQHGSFSVPSPGVTANDLFPANPGWNSLGLEILIPPSDGSVSIAADGSFTYTSSSFWTPERDSFRYRYLLDGQPTESAQVTIDIGERRTDFPTTFWEVVFEFPWSGLLTECVVWNGADVIQSELLGSIGVRVDVASATGTLLTGRFVSDRVAHDWTAAVDRRGNLEIVTVSARGQINRGVGFRVAGCE